MCVVCVLGGSLTIMLLARAVRQVTPQRPDAALALISAFLTDRL
jgi:hypothetical protein